VVENPPGSNHHILNKIAGTLLLVSSLAEAQFARIVFFARKGRIEKFTMSKTDMHILMGTTLLKHVDQICESNSMSRSEFIREAIRERLRVLTNIPIRTPDALLAQSRSNNNPIPPAPTTPTDTFDAMLQETRAKMQTRYI